MTKTVNKSRNDESNLTALEHHQQFRQDTYHDRGLLFCKTCNVVVNHKRKSIVLDHIKSQEHEDKKNRLTLEFLYSDFCFNFRFVMNGSKC